MKSISIVNLKQSFKLETFRFVACLILSNWEQLTLNKWKTSDAEQHICLPAFMFLLFRFSFLKVRGLGTQNKLRLYFLYAKGNYKTWKQVMFTRDKGQESRLLGWGVPGIEKPTSHFSGGVPAKTEQWPERMLEKPSNYWYVYNFMKEALLNNSKMWFK